MHRYLCGATLLLLVGAPALSEDPVSPVIIITAPGGPRDADAIRADDIRSSERHDLVQALTRTDPAVSVQDAQNNPFQPNLIYRGFALSPLQGQAQGLAAYVDGGRFNQPFGDTMQFDLLPEAAIERIEIIDTDPIFGLNALGGALVVTTKTGRSAPGRSVSLVDGSYGEIEATGEAGWEGERASTYLAIQHRREDGWRRFSPSRVSSAFADFGYNRDTAGVHLKLIGAYSDLTGNGTAPVELLEADYRAVFTHPDNTQNRFGRLSLHPWLKLGTATRLEATLYVQDFRQRTLNGDAADIEPCDDDEQFLCLESSDEEESAPLTSIDGGMIDNVLAGDDYGVLNRSRTRTAAGGVLVQIVDTRPIGAGENRLIIGFSQDRSRTRFESSTELGELTRDRSVEGLGSIIEQDDGAIAPVSLAANTRYTGVFVTDRFPVFGTLALEAGIRWNHARVRLDDQLGTALDGSHRFQRLNPGAKLVWTPLANISISAGYAESSRAPTPAELSCADEDAPCSLTNFFVSDPPLEQVVARTFELGARGGSRGIDWTVSAYRADNRNDIQFTASHTRGRAFFRNIGDTRRQGLEAGAGYRSGRLTLRAGYAFTDATYRAGFALNSPDNPQSDGDGSIQVKPGDRVPGIPRHRGVISIGYKTDGWSVEGDLQAASGQVLFGDEANLEPRTNAYAVVNLRGSRRIGGGLSLFAEARNVLNEWYATFGSFGNTQEVDLEEAPGASDPRSLGAAAPRRLTIGVEANF